MSQKGVQQSFKNKYLAPGLNVKSQKLLTIDHKFMRETQNFLLYAMHRVGAFVKEIEARGQCL